MSSKLDKTKISTSSGIVSRNTEQLTSTCSSEGLLNQLPPTKRSPLMRPWPFFLCGFWWLKRKKSPNELGHAKNSVTFRIRKGPYFWRIKYGIRLKSHGVKVKRCFWIFCSFDVMVMLINMVVLVYLIQKHTQFICIYIYYIYIYIYPFSPHHSQIFPMDVNEQRLSLFES